MPKSPRTLPDSNFCIQAGTLVTFNEVRPRMFWGFSIEYDARVWGCCGQEHSSFKIKTKYLIKWLSFVFNQRRPLPWAMIFRWKLVSVLLSMQLNAPARCHDDGFERTLKDIISFESGQKGETINDNLTALCLKRLVARLELWGRMISHISSPGSSSQLS